MRDGCTLGTLGRLTKMASSSSLAELRVSSTVKKHSHEPEVIFVTAELIITAGGENLAPVPIEDRIKGELPFLSNVMLIGDKRKFISCLVTLKVSSRVHLHREGYYCRNILHIGREPCITLCVCSVRRILIRESPRMSYSLRQRL